MHKIVYFLTTLFIPIALTTNNAPLTFLSLLQIKYTLDHEGRAVGEGCCGGKRQALSKKVATYLSFVLRHAVVSLPEKCKPTYNCQQVVSVAAILPKSICLKSEKDYEQSSGIITGGKVLSRSDI